MGADKLPYFCYMIQIQPGKSLGGSPTPNAISAVSVLLDLLAKLCKIEHFARQIGIWQITAEHLTPSVKSSIWQKQYMQRNLLVAAAQQCCNISMSCNPLRAVYYLLCIVASISALIRIPKSGYPRFGCPRLGCSRSGFLINLPP